MGLPIVVSDKVGSAGPTDTVRDGVNGIVYRCGDTKHLGECLLPLIKDPERRSKMGRESLRIAEEMGMDASVNGLVNAVHYCTDRKARRGNV